MEKKFKKDIELSSSLFEKTATESDHNQWETDKDERNWINQYFIMTQLKTIKWLLVVIAVILFLTKF
jgi:hypothetical protein